MKDFYRRLKIGWQLVKCVVKFNGPTAIIEKEVYVFRRSMAAQENYDLNPTHIKECIGVVDSFKPLTKQDVEAESCSRQYCGRIDRGILKVLTQQPVTNYEVKHNV